MVYKHLWCSIDHCYIIARHYDNTCMHTVEICFPLMTYPVCMYPLPGNALCRWVSSPTSNSSVGTSIWCFLEQLCSLCALMESSNDFSSSWRAFLQDSDRCSVFGARFIGRNVASNGAEAWVLSKTAQLHPDGSWIEPSTSQFVWLTTPGCEHSITKSLACSVQYPLDQGRSLQNLYSATEAFMPENSVACLATMACCVMGATYQDVVCHCGHIGVPFMVGEPGSHKTEAIKCALAFVWDPREPLLQQSDHSLVLVWCAQAYDHSCCNRWHKWESSRDVGGAHRWCI